MIKLNGSMFTEKGAVAPKARAAIVDYVNAHQEVLAQATPVKGGFVVEVQDSNGNVAYVNLAMSVSAVSLENHAPKARKPRAKATAEDFTIED